MLKKLAKLIYEHELSLGTVGLLISFVYLLVIPMPVSIWRSMPLALSWFSVFLIGDGLNKRIGNGSIFPHRADQLHKLKRLAVAGILMNIINDTTGEFMTRLWYYPGFNPYLFFMLFAPVGYILYGIVLYVFYRLFKRHWDHHIHTGSMTERSSDLFRWVISIEGVLGIIGLSSSIAYYRSLIHEYNIIWYEIYRRVDMPVNVLMFVLSWISIFFLLETACFLLKKNTLTQDIIRGNFVPLISIFSASILCIVFIELFNMPFQIWVFHNWPMNHIRLFEIPVVAYVVWPTQYLLLLPIIRLLDGKNAEQVW